MRSFVAAVGLFTIVPAPPVVEIDRRLAGRTMAAFPWVGLLLGLVGGVLLVAVDLMGAGAFLGAVLALAVVALLTGALHLDGLADTADGLGSRKPREEALRIMRRSDIGPMGVVSLLFVLLVEAGALQTLTEVSAVVAAAAFTVSTTAGRAAVTAATVSPLSARATGFGALFTGVTSRATASLTVAAVIAVAAGLGGVAAMATGEAFSGGGAGLFAVACCAALAVGTAWARHLRTRLDGMTGDVFGSIVEVTQVTFLVAAALGAALI